MLFNYPHGWVIFFQIFTFTRAEMAFFSFFSGNIGEIILEPKLFLPYCWNSRTYTCISASMTTQRTQQRSRECCERRKNRSDEGRGACPRQTRLFRATVVLCASPHNTEHNRSWTRWGTAPYLCVWESKRGRNSDWKRKECAGSAGCQQRSLLSKYKSLQVAFKVMSLWDNKR